MSQKFEGDVEVTGGITTGGNMVVHGADFCLKGRGGGIGRNNGAARALVDGGPDGLILNYDNDFGAVHIGGGVVVHGTDFYLKGRGGGAGNNGGAARALVDGGPKDGLVLNYGNDFGKVTIGGNLVDIACNVVIRGVDFMLNGRGGGAGNNGGAARALVDGGPNDGLVLNYGNDFGKVTIGGNVFVPGDIVLQNADFAEDFTILDVATAEPGTVMVINEDGALQPSERAYDRRVAGVISGAGDYKPAIVLDKQHSANNRLPIALVGKVYCKVDASYAPVEVGDLLTTSPTPGHAMKAADPLKAFGAVIGKALRPLPEGQGLIPILIALQ